MGSATKLADIAVFSAGSAHTQDNIYIIIECKSTDASDSEFDRAIAQLKSYMAPSHNCHFGMAVAGRRVCFREIKRPDGSYEFSLIPDLPHATAPRARFTYVDSSGAAAGPPQISAPQTFPAPSPQVPVPPGRKRRRKSSLGGLVLLGLAAAIMSTGLLVGTCASMSTKGPSPQFPISTPNAENDGSAPTHPVLAPDDDGFIDKRGGWGWGDRCWIHIKAGKWGWARAECDRGMAMNPASPQPRASLLYNLGLIEKGSGNVDAARRYFQQSLALREHPEVRAALNSLP
jgi:hypothetical protein